jgi:outer membrane protein TolC
MKRYSIILFMLVALMVLCRPQYATAQAAAEVTLAQLQAYAKEHYPLLQQEAAYNSILDNKIQALNANYLPSLNVTGQATYQSEVTKFNFSLPGQVPFQQKPDQYSVGVEARENLLDYGVVKTQKEIERSNAAGQVQQLAVEYEKIKERINQLFGNICLQQENLKITNLRLGELDAKRKKAESAVTNGAALQSSFLVLQSEYFSTEQKLEEIHSNLRIWYKTLNLLTGKEFDGGTVFLGNEQDVNLQTVNIRPEFKLFELQNSTLQFRQRMLYKTNLPKLFVFARGYFGRPGFNFLNNDFRPYGLVGLGLSWNLTNYYTISKEASNLRLNTEIVRMQKETFDLNIKATLLAQEEEIAKLERLILMDAKIVEAKTAIRKASSSQLDNGVITSADYIVDLNGENQAQFNQKLHEIQLMMAKQNYNTALGY